MRALKDIEADIFLSVRLPAFRNKERLRRMESLQRGISELRRFYTGISARYLIDVLRRHSDLCGMSEYRVLAYALHTHKGLIRDVVGFSVHRRTTDFKLLFGENFSFK